MDGDGAPVFAGATDMLSVRRSTRSTCCYCGVGCGVLIESERTAGGERIVGVQGDPEHPANFGRLCSKGRALAQSAQSLQGRLLTPELRISRDAPRARVSWTEALEHVAERLSAIIEQYGPDAVAFYVSGQLLTEDYYVFNQLAKGLVGSNNIDSNSRLCMSSAVTGYKLALGADGPPTCYDDLEAAKTVLFAGSNMAYAHPVLFRRLEAARERDPDVRWIVIDPRRTDTAALADLHLAIEPGTDVALFNGMLHHLIWDDLIDRDYIARHTSGFDDLKRTVRDYPPAMAAQLCGISVADLVQAAEWFALSPASLSLYCMGLNQSAHGTDKNLALIHLHLATGQIGKAGAGPFSLTGQPNAMGGREVGAMATMLAAHREIESDRDRTELEQLWGLRIGSLSARPGLSAVPMFDALRAGRVKAVWIACTNPVHSMPDLTRVREALQAAELVIVQEAFAQTDTVPYADVLLPAATWGEKDGSVTNSERRISRVRAAVAAPGEAKPDWWIAQEVARRIEARLPSRQCEGAAQSLFAFAGPEDIFDEHRRLTRGRDLDFSGLDYARLDAAGPQQWPLPEGAAQGAARRYTDGVFATDDGRARFQPTPYRPVAEAISSHYPLRLLTGRLRDQWHGMSRTGRVTGLMTHSPEPSLCMNPADAARRGLSAGDLVRVKSKRGALVLPLELSDEMRSGTVFAAMHWSGQFLASSGINEVSQPAIDARSQQPELKHAAVRVEKAEFAQQWLVARRGNVLAMHTMMQPWLSAFEYAAIGLYPSAMPAGDAGADDGDGEAWLVLRASSEAVCETALDAITSALGLLPSTETLEYRDPRRGQLKRVLWRESKEGSCIDGLLLQSAQRARLDEGLLDLALTDAPWAGPRLAVFSRRDSGAARDRVICSCMQVRDSQIRALVAQGADVAALKQTLGCGTVCGSCLPQLSQLSKTAARSAS